MAKKKVSDCPLFLHQNGQWAKKVRQKLHYFGSDKDVALKRWVAEKDYILAGVATPKNDPNPSIVELANVFAANCREKVAAGDIEARTADEYENTVGRMITFVGKECRITQLSPLDFASIKAKLAEPIAKPKTLKGGRTVKRRSPGSVAGDIRRLRVFLNWCWDSELIDRPPRYGKDFSPPSRKVVRRQRAKDGRKDFSAEQVLAILEQCTPSMRAIVLVALNAGIGNQDIADLSFAHTGDLGRSQVLVDYPRGKTGAPRRFYLWPETRQAIQDYQAKRPKPILPRYAELVFLTRLGHPWIRRDGKNTTDSISFEFSKARKAAGLDRGTFYDLRRTFRTVAAETLDREAVDFVMGHADDADDMGSLYTQNISNERIKAVCDHVHDWLYGVTK